MTYDLYLWKRKRGTTVTAGLAYLCVVENVPCEGLTSIPRKRVLGSVTERFGPEPAFELVLAKTHAFVGLGHSQTVELVPWFEKLAQQLSLELYNPQEEGPNPDDERAFDVMQKAHATASSDEGVQRWLTQAEEGDAAAMNELGNCYAEGEGVDVDPLEALRWYERAAAKGFLPALLNLAECHRCGDGVAKDAHVAARLYAQAYEREQCVAAFALGEMYRDGEGVERSTDRAAEYFTAARKNRHPEAYLALKGIGRAPRD